MCNRRHFQQEGTLEAEGVTTLTCGEYRFPDCAENGRQVFLDDPLAVELEGFDPVQKKPQLDTDTSVCLTPNVLVS